MTKCIHYILICIGWTLLFDNPLAAQNSIKGKVIDDQSNPIAEALVSVNGSQFVTTRNDGSFVIPPAVADKPEVVKANKQGLILKDWTFQAGEVKVIMTPPSTIKGRVLSNRTVPVEGINVLLFGVRGLEAVKSDANGYFSMVVPQNTPINKNSRFIVFDPARLKGTANYEVEMREGLVYLFVDIPPLPVRTVRVIDETQQALANVNVVIDKQSYTTNQKGEVNPQTATNFSEFQVKNYFIKNLTYNDVESTMEITARVMELGETEEQKALTTIDDKKVTLSFAFGSLTEENQALTTNIINIETRLASDNITPEQRRQLQEQLKILKEQLSQNQKALGYVREQAQDAVLELEKLLTTQKGLTENTQKKLEETEELKKEAEDKAQLLNQLAQRNWIIFVVIALALISIAVILFVNYRQIRNKKNELDEKVEEINKKNDELAEKVQEINQKNEMLEESATIMDLKNKQINDKNEQLLVKTEELEEKNKHITDSIRYAETIQQSILPDIEQMKTLLPEMFVFYKPKDIVSGDFYWFSAKEDIILIAAADCTGHGVPGAFMTMMGSSILNQVVNESNITDPAEILDLLNANVQANLHRQTSHEQRDGDGMDISMLRIDLKNSEITFAGAKNPLYLVQEGELLYYKGSNISIGSVLKSKHKKFESRTIKVNGGEIVYLVSDGFQDQLGGNKYEDKPKKKFMKTRFIKLLSEHNYLPFEEQYQVLEREFEEWKGSNSQTDDVVVIGFKIPKQLLNNYTSSSNQTLLTRNW